MTKFKAGDIVWVFNYSDVYDVIPGRRVSAHEGVIKKVTKKGCLVESQGATYYPDCLFEDEQDARDFLRDYLG